MTKIIAALLALILATLLFGKASVLGFLVWAVPVYVVFLVCLAAFVVSMEKRRDERQRLREVEEIGRQMAQERAQWAKEKAQQEAEREARAAYWREHPKEYEHAQDMMIAETDAWLEARGIR